MVIVTGSMFNGEKYGCAPIINHKTGNSIEILSRADAERMLN
jgi:hypothetical protein